MTIADSRGRVREYPPLQSWTPAAGMWVPIAVDGFGGVWLAHELEQRLQRIEEKLDRLLAEKLNGQP